MSRARCLSTLTVFLSALIPLQDLSLACQRKTRSGSANSAGGVVGRFIAATQKGDLRTVVTSMYRFKLDIQAIHTGNPRVLWDKLTNDYYNDKVSQLSQAPGFWQSYGENLAGMTGDPSGQIRAVLPLLRTASTWHVTESRPGPAHDQYIDYVAVDYQSLETSPEIDGRYVKQVLLEFSVHRATQSIIGVSRVAKADIPWSKPYSASAISFLSRKYGSDLLAAANPDAGKYYVDKLEDLGWDIAEPQLLGALARGGGSYAAVAQTLGQHGERKAAPILTNRLKSWFANNNHPDGCNNDIQWTVWALGRTGQDTSSDSVAALKTAWSKTLTRDPRPLCANIYLDALSTLDDPKWHAFRYWYPGSTDTSENDFTGDSQSEFTRLLLILNRGQARSPRLDQNSPDIVATRQYLSRHMYSCQAVSPPWECPSNFIFEYLTVTGPQSVEVFGHIESYNEVYQGRPSYMSGKRTTGSFRMRLRASDNPKTPWLVESITDR